MKRVALLLVLLAGACGRRAEDVALDGMKDWKAKMCACKDADCAAKVDEGFDRWMHGMAKQMDERPSEQMRDAFDELQSRYLTCKARLTGE